VLGLIISAIVVGLIIGALGRLVVPGRQDISIWVTIAIGIVAALVGSLIASALGVGETRGIDWIKLIIQVALAAAGGGRPWSPASTHLGEGGPAAQATADRAGIQPHRSTSQARIMPRTRARCVQGWPDRACNRADACCCGARLGTAVGRLELCRYCPIRRCGRLIRPAAKFG
jgi:uncharacterized membrane protein YeaQ/YmgE (transglycosylase-associated protein family)